MSQKNEIKRLPLSTREVLESLPDAFLAFDAAWRYVYLNRRAEDLLGRPREELLGRVCWDVCPETVGTALYARFAEAMETRRSVVFEHPYGEAGTWMEFSLHPYSGGIAAFARDITGRRLADERARRLVADLAEERDTLDTVNRIGRLLSAELDLDRLVQAATDAGRELTGAQFGAFFYNNVDARGDEYLLYTLSGAPREAFSGFEHPRATDLFGPTFRGEGIIRVGDVTKDPRYGRMPPHFGMPSDHLPVRSYLAVPVVSRAGDVLGGLFFGHERADVFTERAERNLEALAAQVAVAVDNARLYADARRKLEAQARQALHAALRADVNAALAESGSLSDILQRCAELLVSHLDIALARVWTLDERAGVLTLEASAGLYTHRDGAYSRVPVGRKEIGRIAGERRPYRSDDVAGDERIGEPEWARREGIVAFAGYPLLLEERVVGVVALFSRHPLPAETHDELATIAGLLAQAVERKRVEERLERSEARERTFLRDVLASVTGGKLRLCDGPADLPPRLAAPAGDPVPLSPRTLRDMRRRTAEAARGLEYAPEREQDLVTAVGEIAMNAVAHAGGGSGWVAADPATGVVQVRVEDRGQGIDLGRLPQATLERGYTSKPGLGFGHGFWLTLRTISRLWLLTGATGTTVVLEQDRDAPAPSWLGGV